MIYVPAEEEAKAEIADINALLEEAENTMRSLRSRRAQLVPASQASGRRIAVAVHAIFCESNHSAGDCKFRSMEWDDWGYYRSLWVSRAQRMLEASGEEPEAFLEALGTLASPDQWEKIMAETEKVAEVEREAMNPEGDPT